MQLEISMVTTLTPTMDDKEPKTSPEVNKSNETTTIEQVPTLKMVSHQSNSIYRSILLAYWLVVLICIPIWWSMTSIERLSLPNSRILHQEEAVKDVRGSNWNLNATHQVTIAPLQR